MTIEIIIPFPDWANRARPGKSVCEKRLDPFFALGGGHDILRQEMICGRNIQAVAQAFMR